MWNPFKKVTEVVLTKPVSVQLQIILAMEEMIDSLNTQTLPMPKKESLPVPDEVQALMDAGFVNHKKVVTFKEKQKSLDDDFMKKSKAYNDQSNRIIDLKASLKLLLKARKTYGPDTLLMPLEQFMQICKKYNLVCGTFDQYTGDIPIEKLKEINRLRSLRAIHDSGFKVNKIIKTGSGGSISSMEYQEFDEHFDKKFPILRYCHGPYVYRVKFLDGHVSDLSYININGTYDQYFIAAPKEMMSGEVQEVYEPNKDPIIWGLKDNNVLIFTRWGEEANDEVIQRYEAFNRKLDAFAATLTE